MKNRWYSPAVATLALVILASVACNTVIPVPDAMDEMSTALTFSGLESLGDGFEYEGWFIVNGAPVSTGRFSIDANGAATPSTFEVDADDADNAATFVLTIEPTENDPPAPADTHVLAGDFSGSMAPLTVGHAAALGDDFASAAGTFIMNTPSTADTDEDFDQGIWWLEVTDSSMVASLELPTLPAGWMYEGWIVDEGEPVSTGRFTAVDEADDDGAGPTSGMDGFPPFPGQDFIDPPRMLIGQMAVVSVEPDPDDNVAPFALKPLVDMSIDDVAIGVSQAMANMSANNPTGTAEVMTP